MQQIGSGFSPHTSRQQTRGQDALGGKLPNFWHNPRRSEPSEKMLIYQACIASTIRWALRMGGSLAAIMPAQTARLERPQALENSWRAAHASLDCDDAPRPWI